jgi:acyl-CoA synthetase (AMP-forming)/AMP-acid ligase II
MEMTLSTLLKIGANNTPNHEALVFENARAAFGELYERASQRANALLSLGVKKGDHVATLSKNSLELVETFFGLWGIGAVVVPLNYRLSTKELCYILEHSDVSTLIFHNEFEEAVRRMRPSLPMINKLLVIGEEIPQYAVDFETETGIQSFVMPKIDVRGKDDATILYTSGTTGAPKGVVHTHEQWAWAAANGIIGNNPRDDRFLTVYPLFHAGAFAAMFIVVFGGSTAVFLREFDQRRMIEMICREKITRLANPPTVYRMLLQLPGISEYDLRSVRCLQSGSEKMAEETRKQVSRLFPNAGIMENYGLTETCGLLATRWPEHTASKPGSVGLPHPFMEIRVVDSKGNKVGPDEVGEIIARGPNIMKEYYKDPEKTASAIRDGWLHTGDLGRFDEDGFLYVIERSQHMIISGGENIYPKEVEEVVRSHPKVAEVAVFGLPDKHWGEKVCAAIVLNKGEMMSAEDVITFCRENLASFKKPKNVFFCESLPKSAIGKVLRTKLKEEFGQS